MNIARRISTRGMAAFGLLNLFLAGAPAGAQTVTNWYHTNRVFRAVTSSIPGVVTAYQVCDAAGRLTEVVGPTNVIVSTNVHWFWGAETFAREYEAVAWGYPSAEAAWAAAVSNYTNYHQTYTNETYDNVGWVKGTRQAYGDWGAFLWFMENQVTFRTSPTNIWISPGGITNYIAQVLVGTIGDYPPLTDTVDVGPTNRTAVTNFPGAGQSIDVVSKADFSAYYSLLRTEYIKASCPLADNDPQFFTGHQPWPFDPTKGVLEGGPGKHLVIFYEDAIDANFVVQDFDIDLTASVVPAVVSDEDLSEFWDHPSPPWSGNFNRTDTFEVKYQNPKEGGVYKLTFDLGLSVYERSEANVVLPLAGATVDSVVAADLARADAFASTVVARYGLLQRMRHFKRWFVWNAGGDYNGRPDNTVLPTVRLYNQVIGNEAPDDPKWGWGAVCTWKGQPIRIGKISNFIVAYGMRKICDITLVGWAASRYRGEIGTMNDESAFQSWDAGWAVGGGADYDSTASALVRSVFDKSDDKNRKLWPNSDVADNYVVFQYFSDPDTQFTSPGYLYMTNP